MSRFYVEGYEIDVQNPMFFISENHLKETQESIVELLEIHPKGYAANEQ